MIFQPILPNYIVIPGAVAAAALLIVPMLLKRDEVVLYKALRAAKTILIAALAAIILLRPMKEVPDMDVETKNLDVLFVVDDTISMWATDYRGKTRMSGVLSDCEEIIARLDGANFGLIKFDNRAQILAPFTQDKDNVLDAFSTLQMPDRYYARGSSLNTPYEAMEELLVSSSKKEDRQTIVFFVSDGEITDNSDLQSYAGLAGFVDDGAVLGYGTKEGAKMQDTYGSTLYDFEEHTDAISRLDETTLLQIAEDLGISYYHMDDPSRIYAKCDAIRAGSSKVQGSRRTVIYEDLYYWFAGPLLILLAADLFLFLWRRRL